MAQDCYKTTEGKEHPRLARAVLQIVNIYSTEYLELWLQCSLVFAPISPTKSNKKETWNERK